MFECLHAATCLSDYWGGHHLPHVSISAYPMSLEQLKDALKSEINQGAVAGGHDYGWEFFESDAWFVAATTAINAIVLKEGCTIVFADCMEELEEEEEGPRAYFIFREC